MRIFTRKSHLISLGTAILISVVVGFAFYNEWREYSKVHNSADQARTRIEQIEQVLSVAKDAETGNVDMS